MLKVVSTLPKRVLTKRKSFQEKIGAALMSRLDERKEKILTAIIRNYLENGEPVGSTTISK